MPFGLINSGSSFCRLVQEAYKDQVGESILGYVDDVVAFTEEIDGPKGHLAVLRKLFEDTVKAKLKFKPKKVHLFRSSIDYLGNTITGSGIQSCDKNVKKVVDFPVPTCKNELQAAMGLLNFFRHFIPSYSILARPLFDLLRGNVPWEWNENLQTIFETLKHRITSKPILAHPDFSKPFVIYVDASKWGFGAVLCQRDEQKKEHPVAFESKRTSKVQENLGAATKLEAQAILWAVRAFRYYVDGHDTTVYTDCEPLIPMFHAPKRHHECYKESVLLQPYRITVKYKRGEENSCADALSRLPNENAPISQLSYFQLLNTQQQFDFWNRELFTFSLEQMRAFQLQDPEISPYIQYLEDDEIPTLPALRKSIVSTSRKFQMAKQILCRRGGQWLLPVVPLHERSKLLTRLHTHFGHFAVFKMYGFLKNRAWWMGMRADCMAFAASCETCARINDAPLV